MKMADTCKGKDTDSHEDCKTVDIFEASQCGLVNKNNIIIIIFFIFFCLDLLVGLVMCKLNSEFSLIISLLKIRV